MQKTVWYRVANRDELPEGRVKTVTAGHQSLALTHFDGKFSALVENIIFSFENRG